MVSREPTFFLKQEYTALLEKNLAWRLRVLETTSQPHATVNGKNVLMLCSNNYLGLSTHPKLVQATIEATQKYGAGSGSVPAVAGYMSLHKQFEEKLAEFKHVEAALCCQTGFAVNSGLIPQLASEGDLIISDELNHGSIIDGVRLSKAERGVYKHSDVADLERILNEADSRQKKF